MLKCGFFVKAFLLGCRVRSTLKFLECHQINQRTYGTIPVKTSCEIMCIDDIVNYVRMSMFFTLALPLHHRNRSLEDLFFFLNDSEPVFLFISFLFLFHFEEDFVRDIFHMRIARRIIAIEETGLKCFKIL